MNDNILDDKIADLYSRGVLTNEIADQLGLRVVDVIGRLRALEVNPPRMSARRLLTTEPETAPISLLEQPIPPVAKPVIVRPRPTPPTFPRCGSSTGLTNSKGARRAKAPTIDEPLGDDEEDEDDATPRRAGVPKGWLVTEEELDRAFADAKFENLNFRPSPLRRRG